MRRGRFLSVFCMLSAWVCTPASRAEDLRLFSPDSSLCVCVSLEDTLAFSLAADGRPLLNPSPLRMHFRQGVQPGLVPRLKRIRRRMTDDTVLPVVPLKFSRIPEQYAEMVLEMEGGYDVVFRAYDNGIAYRFVTGFQGNRVVENETVDLRLAGNPGVYFPEEESFLTHSEREYRVLRADSIQSGQMASLPVLIAWDHGMKLAVTESDLRDYPGLYMRGTGQPRLRGIFPAVALKEVQIRDRTVKVEKRAGYIAKTAGTRAYPWRVLAFSRQDADLLTNELVYLLAGPCRLDDVSWIRPGKVAWDWWNDLNLYGVDFRAGVNTKTYEYYIDFASRHGIEYIILDEGWYELGDLFKVKPEVDIPALVEYGRSRDVGIILWVVWKTLDDQLEPALDRFAQWGIRGIKVDFMQRDDQWMVNFYYRIAEAAAKRRLLVNFHGSYKPSGIRRVFPNVLTREGVRGLEHSKWSVFPTPGHNVTLPFIRMLAGPMDYTPGAMINAHESGFKARWSRPMSLGTRCHQLAMYVIYESPLQMLADSPSNYEREPECMEFLSRVPVVWDSTVVLEARVGEYAVLARRSKGTWFIGAMTAEPREFDLDLSFLTGGSHYSALVFQDGPNAGRHAEDFLKIRKTLSAEDRISIRLAKGGGWAAVLDGMQR